MTFPPDLLANCCALSCAKAWEQYSSVFRPSKGMIAHPVLLIISPSGVN